MTASPLEARCSVTSLEALRRLIEVAKWPDAHWFSSEEDWCAFQTQLAVAEMVLRDAAPVAAQPPHVWAEAWHDLRDDVLSGVDGLDNDQVNTVLGMLDNYEPAAAPPPAAQPSDDVALTDKQCAKIKAKAAKATDDWLESQPEDNPQLKSDGIFIRHIAAAIKAAMAQEKA